MYAIRSARSGSSGRSGPPQATAKIRPFELAQALALSSADGEVPTSSKPLRDDDAPFVPGELEVVGEEEVPFGDSKPPAATSAAPMEIVEPKSRLGLVIFGVLVGFAAIAYVFVVVNR